MTTVRFITPTKISLMDLTSMGDSKKRENDNLLGKFDSGLKYSLAMCLRNKIDININVYNNHSLEEAFSFNSTITTCDSTGKEKELITVYQHNAQKETVTGFATALGYNWELWMVLRELWSNMLDEDGWLGDESSTVTTGTVVEISFDEESEFAEIWDNKHLYINTEEPLYTISSKVDVLKNEEGWLRVYKQNILVYQDESRPSRYAYNIRFGQIDERRILSNLYNIETEIITAIKYTDNEQFLREIIQADFKTQEKEFLTGQTTYGNASDLAHSIATEVYERHGKVSSYEWLIDAIKKRKDCKIGGKIIQSVSDSIWNYSTDVKVESKPEVISEPDIEVEDVVYESSFSAEIKKHYNFKLDVEVKVAKLKGSKVIADKFEKCLIIDESFELKEDFGTFIIEYIDLTQKGNVVKNLGEYIANFLKINR